MNMSNLYCIDHYLANHLNHHEIQKVSFISLIGILYPSCRALSFIYACINIVHIFLIPIVGITHTRPGALTWHFNSCQLRAVSWQLTDLHRSRKHPKRDLPDPTEIHADAGCLMATVCYTLLFSLPKILCLGVLQEKHGSRPHAARVNRYKA
jgi:hypothetical protein